jgi:serpin B
VDRAFMHRLSRVDYWANASFQAVRLPYEGGDFAMTIVLPRDGTKLAQLTPELLGHIRGHLRLQRVRLSIPKFHIEYGTEASGALERLGLKTAFTRAADFSGIRRPTRDDPLYLTKAFQRTYLDVYEKGTEAAAATALIAEMGASRLAMESIPPFDANHPFFFSIENVRTGTVLFEGRLAKP